MLTISAQTISEQSKASFEVAQRVEQITQMSQHNNHAARDLAQAAQQLDSVAATMQASVALFRT